MTADAERNAGQRRKFGFLVRSTFALISTSVVTSGLGFVYWALAARLFPASDVGASATAIAAMNLIAPFALLGLGTALVSRLPTMSQQRAELVSSAALLCGAAGGAVALVLAMVLPADFIGLPDVGRSLLPTLLFAAGVAAQGVGLMVDSALLSVVGGGVQFRRNAIFATAKLVLLVVFALTLSWAGSLSIYVSWLGANLIGIAAVVIWLVRSHRIRLRRLWPAPSLLRGMPFHAARHHALNMALQVPFFAMPIVANVTLGSEQAGYLYATWSVASFVFVLPMALSTALFASGARDSRSVVTELRFTLRSSLAACVVANLLILPFGGLVLSIFGPDYAANGHTALIVLCLGALGVIIKDHHVALARITGTVGREAVLIGSLGAVELAGAAFGAKHGGLTGLTLGWLAVVVLKALICGPTVVAAYRGRLPMKTAAPPSAGRHAVGDE
jgi:O-antigen/teichoic acid export membrane protein